MTGCTCRVTQCGRHCRSSNGLGSFTIGRLQDGCSSSSGSGTGQCTTSTDLTCRSWAGYMSGHRSVTYRPRCTKHGSRRWDCEVMATGWCGSCSSGGSDRSSGPNYGTGNRIDGPQTHGLRGRFS